MKSKRSASSLRDAGKSGRYQKVSLVGAGAVGSTLAALLYEKGYSIVSIVSRSAKPALALGKAVRCRRVSTSLADLRPDTEFLLIAVSDSQLREVARAVSLETRLKFKKLFVAHTSGAHSTEVLKPLQKRGASVASMHPVQSFPQSKSLRERVKSVRGISFGVDGESKAVAIAQAIIHDLGARAVFIPKNLKPLYHAACVFSSNYVVTLLNAVAETSGVLGLQQQWREMVLPLFTSTAENAFRTSPREALTGPVIRHDLETVRLHLQALNAFAPQLIPLYSVSAIETARVAQVNGLLGRDQFRELIHHVHQFVRSHLRSKPNGKKEKK